MIVGNTREGGELKMPKGIFKRKRLTKNEYLRIRAKLILNGIFKLQEKRTEIFEQIKKGEGIKWN